MDGEYKKLVSGNYFSWQENMSQQEAEQFEIEQKQKERDFENLLRTTLTTKKGFKKGNFGDTRADSDHYGQL